MLQVSVTPGKKDALLGLASQDSESANVVIESSTHPIRKRDACAQHSLDRNTTDPTDNNVLDAWKQNV